MVTIQTQVHATAYTPKYEKARKESVKRLIEEAKGMGANTIVGVDFETSEILQGTAKLFQLTEQQ